MPYIAKYRRKELDPFIEELLSKSLNAGDLNYIISSIIVSLFNSSPSYKRGNSIIGVLECAKLEFYRRVLGIYEDEVRDRNGDLTPVEGIEYVC